MQTNDKPEGTQGKETETRPAQAHGGVSSPVRHGTQLKLPVNLGGRRKLLWLSSHHFWASLVAQLVKNPKCGRPAVDPCVGKIPWRRERLPASPFLPGEFHELYSPQGHKESDMTKLL